MADEMRSPENRVRELEAELERVRGGARPAAEPEDPALQETRASFPLDKGADRGRFDDSAPLYAWLIRGWVGGASMIVRLIRSGQALPQGWRDTLRETAEQLLKALPKD